MIRPRVVSLHALGVLLGTLVLATLVTGCGPDGKKVEDDTPDAAQPDAAQPVCAFETCGAACVDTDVTRAHCGACGNVCARSEDCVAGACTPCMPVVVTRANALGDALFAPECLSIESPDTCPTFQAGFYTAEEGVRADAYEVVVCADYETWFFSHRGDEISTFAVRLLEGSMDATQMLPGARFPYDVEVHPGEGVIEIRGAGDASVVVSIPFVQGADPCAQTVCGGECVDTQSDVTNCGECGLVCEGTLRCLEGVCEGPV